MQRVSAATEAHVLRQPVTRFKASSREIRQEKVLPSPCVHLCYNPAGVTLSDVCISANYHKHTPMRGCIPMSARFTRLLRRALISIGVCLGLLVVGGCVLPIVFDRYLAAEPYLDRLVGTSAWHTTDEAQTLLLRRLPPGTPEAAIYAFLESNGIERDRFTGGQLMRYQVKNEHQTILGLLSDSPLRLSFVCRGGGYIIWFHLDDRDRLSDIIIRSTSVCL